MHFHQVRWCVGLLLFLTGLSLFAWGAWPAGNRLSLLMVQPHEMQLALARQTPSGGGGTSKDITAAVPAILEVRRLALETPRFLRPGDPGTVRLVFTTDPGQAVDGKINGLSNLYDTHYVAVVVRLEMGGLAVDPSGTLTRPLAPEQPVSFQWALLPGQAPVYEGMAWFYLRFMPRDGSPSSDWPLAAQRIKLPSISLLGLSGRLMRWLGGVGALSGSLLLADLLVCPLQRRLGMSSTKAAK